MNRSYPKSLPEIPGLPQIRRRRCSADTDPRGVPVSRLRGVELDRYLELWLAFISMPDDCVFDMPSLQS